jgi:pilus assembly protein Flp/PilA
MECTTMLSEFKSFCCEDDGATAIEYGLIAALVSVAAIGALTTLGNNLNIMFGTVANAMNTAVSG